MRSLSGLHTLLPAFARPCCTALAVVLLSGCASRSLTSGEILSSNQAVIGVEAAGSLARPSEGPAKGVFLWVRPGQRIDAARFFVADVRFAQEKDASGQILPAEKEELVDVLSKSLKADLSPSGTPEGALALDVRGIISRAETPNLVFNYISLVAPLPPVFSNGGAAIEVEMRDSRSGELQVVFACADVGSVKSLKGYFNRLDHPRLAIRECSRRLALAVGVMKDGTPLPRVADRGPGDENRDGGWPVLPSQP